MPKPVLKQFGDLKHQDFIDHSVWVHCHVIDFEEDWYDETNEETFRPWLNAKPVGADTMYLVASRFVFADKSVFTGFVTPKLSKEVFKVRDLGIIQPNVFSSSGERLSFWFGMFNSPESIRKFYVSFNKNASQVFPIAFEALPGLTSELVSGNIPGFCTSDGNVRLAP